MHALSIPTWIVHISSVLEWMAAIWFVAQLDRRCPEQGWRWLAWAMFPALVSAMCACTWHYFDNAATLAWLVDLQALLTFIGNCTLCGAAAWLWWRSQSVSSP
ncbi:MAG: DUF2499 domain-containing protein [Thermosynechococcus sp.]|uniref:DUF2499 domain-containing protein n=1 Tax=Thermosynechococcus sp. TaxID=2814275 RepID=UPI00391891F3